MAIQGVCNTCGSVIWLDEMWRSYGCPTCRAAKVTEAFKPVNALRTALGVFGSGSFRISKEGEIKPMDEHEIELQAAHDWYWHGPEVTRGGAKVFEPEPEGFRIPKTEAEQVYTLRRWFRL